ncbi:hypothetical protein FRAAL1838 [Frankia alni ACN14a]|uniref:Uncharacterized protein n=1 Tax=Frankia alni (strain DSM 45986 / CECT 9034 / ACN14a) TaxID=326424 RepID=Q0RPP2_FRAAA|nr:hypothetical protein FRAAL1838 [Frankia alni ACN14a]
MVREPQARGTDTLLGAPGRDRTCDLVLRRHSLYPLSYGRVGTGGAYREAPPSVASPDQVLDTRGRVAGR